MPQGCCRRIDKSAENAWDLSIPSEHFGRACNAKIKFLHSGVFTDWGAMETDREKSKLAEVYSDIDALVSAADIIVAHSTNKKNIRELALEGLNLSECADILDLGCAFGPFTRVLKGRVHPRACVTGIDCHRHYEDMFMRSCTEAGVKGKFYASGISEIAGFEEKRFDLILSSYSLYFFPEYISRISELLKDSGLFVAVTHSLPHMKELTDTVKDILVKNCRFERTNLPLESLLARFSNENGYEILSRWMGNIKTREYENALVFKPVDFPDFIKYFRCKSDFFIPGGAYSKENIMEHVEFILKKEILQNKGMVISKDDVIFICSEPLHRGQNEKKIQTILSSLRRDGFKKKRRGHTAGTLRGMPDFLL